MEQIRYLRQKSLVPLLNELLTTVVREKPADPLEFMLKKLADIERDVGVAKLTTKDRRSRRDEAIAASRQAEAAVALPSQRVVLPRLQPALPCVVAALETNDHGRFQLCRQLAAMHMEPGTALPVAATEAFKPLQATADDPRPHLSILFAIEEERSGLRPATRAMSHAAKSNVHLELPRSKSALSTLLQYCSSSGREEASASSGAADCELGGLALLSKLLSDDSEAPVPNNIELEQSQPADFARTQQEVQPQTVATCTSSLASSPLLRALVMECFGAHEQVNYPNLCLLYSTGELPTSRVERAAKVGGPSSTADVPRLSCLSGLAGVHTDGSYPNLALLASLAGARAAPLRDVECSFPALRLLLNSESTSGGDHPLLDLLLCSA